MNNILLVCDRVQEINRMRRCFDAGFVIKATSSPQNALDIIDPANPAAGQVDLIVYNIGSDYKELFGFYRRLKNDEQTALIPMIVIADINVEKPLLETVEMLDTHIIATAATEEKLRRLAVSILIEK